MLQQTLTHEQYMYELAVRAYNLCEENINCALDATRLHIAWMWMREQQRWHADMTAWGSK